MQYNIYIIYKLFNIYYGPEGGNIGATTCPIAPQCNNLPTPLVGQRVFLYKDALCVQHPLPPFGPEGGENHHAWLQHGHHRAPMVAVQHPLKRWKKNSISQNPRKPKNHNITISQTPQTTNPNHHISRIWNIIYVYNSLNVIYYII